MLRRFLSNQHALRRLLAAACAALLIGSGFAAHAVDFINFESGQVRPLAMSADGSQLYAVNTPDNRLEIYAVRSAGLVHLSSLAVGMEPVAVGVAPNGNVWVVNHLSDSISIVAVDATPRVVNTLLVGDEPRDIVFAGSAGSERAFITTAHRGQRRTAAALNGVVGAGDPQLTTAGVGRADVWVFASNPSPAVAGGVPLEIVVLFGDTPRALAVSEDGQTVYAAVFMAGNKTAVVSEGVVCNGFGNTGACSGDGVTSPNGLANGQLPGGLPGPDANVHGDPAPETGLVVQYHDASGQWRDAQGRNWSNGIRFSLPDYDVFEIDADTLALGNRHSGVGTVLFNMVTNPVNGKVYVSNTDARNLTRFEGVGGGGSTVQGNLHQARISVIDGQNVNSRHLNKHIDYSVTPAPATTAAHSLATPVEMVVSADGETLYVAAFGSSKIGVFDTAQLEDDSFDPTLTSAAYIDVSGGGPSGLALDAANNRLYVLTRFDNAIAIVDTVSGSQISTLALPNPEPVAVRDGRPFLYAADLTSSNGEASCASCHIFGDMDGLAWDLGDPDGEVIVNPIEINLAAIAAITGQASPTINGSGALFELHPMKGPMTTQTLRGMVNSGAMHWRGDRSVGSFGSDASDSAISFMNFNPAFVGLVGRDSQLSIADMMAYTQFALSIALPPNPVRRLDNALSASADNGRDFYDGPVRSDGLPFDVTGVQDGFTCNGCHTLDPAQGFFGTGTKASFEAEEQVMKIPHLRNLYQKVGMFGSPNIDFLNPGDGSHQGDQVRGTGFLHDGSIGTVGRFFDATVFNSAFGGDVGFPNNQARLDMEQFMLEFDTDLAPIVGQQVTQSGADVGGETSRIDLLLARAATPFVSKILGGAVTEADVVVHGVIDNSMVAFVRLADGRFQSNRANVAPLTAAALRALVNGPDDYLTYTAVPPGTGLRSGIDRDRDGVFDGDDLCPNVADSDQLDADGDGIGSACDNCTLSANTDQNDTNGDGFGNACDADLNQDNIVNASDLGLFRTAFFSTGLQDSDFNGDGLVNATDLGIMRNRFFAAPGPSALVP